jgi:cytochrome c556
MKIKSNTLALIGAVLASMLVIGCSQGGGGGGAGAQAVDDSPEAVAFRYRQGLMRSIAWKVAQLRGMAAGEIPVNEEAFKKHANDVVILAGMIPEGFIPNSAVEGSAALPEIWTNMSDFRQKAVDFQTAAQGLATAANTGGSAAGQPLVQGVGQTCGGCHRPYRRRAE